ncbi:MAG: hypothetical protein M3245_03600, partial [Actinomycetota bacterium]|nr:hypothetical protein [Actinomycetota bacterium]
MEVIIKRRRYTLAEAEGSVVILDADAGSDPIELFPLTDEGFATAERRFWDLVALDRHGRFPKVLWVTVCVGIAVWGLAGLLATLISLLLATARAAESWAALANFFQVLDDLGYRLGLGSLIVMAAYRLLHWERPTMEGPADERPSAVRDRRVSGWEPIIGVVLV